MPADISNWLKLTESPSRLVEVSPEKAVFEYVSGGQTKRVEVDLSNFVLPPTYNRCTKIYTFGNTENTARTSETIETATEVMHVACFSSDDDPNNDYYVTFKSSFEKPVAETVALKDLTVENNTIYNAGEKLDYNDLTIKAEYTNGKTEELQPENVTFSKPEDTVVTVGMDTNNTVEYTNEAGEKKTVNYEIKYKKLKKLTVTPPNKLRYGLYEYFDYTGFSAVVEYVNGATKDVTDDVYISSKKTDCVTPETNPTVTVTYTEMSGDFLESLTQTYELDLVYWGMYVRWKPDKLLYRIGETTDYTGLKLIAGGSIVDKDDCVFSVPEGTAVTDTTDEIIEVSYNKFGKKYATAFEIYIVGKNYGKIIESIEITSQPAKTSYIKGEYLDFTGLEVLCRYTDGTAKNVTSLVKFDTDLKKAVDASTPRTINITYSEEYSGSFTANFEIETSIIAGLEVIPPERTIYTLTKLLRYTGLKAVCRYTDGTSNDVSSLVVCTPAKGETVTKNTPKTVEVKYTEGFFTVSSSFELEIYTTHALRLGNVAGQNYLYGDTLDFSHIRVTADCYDGSSENVTDNAIFEPHSGDIVSPSTPKEVTVSYERVSTKFTLNIFDWNRFDVVQPDKTSYVIGERLDFTGLAILYSTETTHGENVTRRATYNIAEGTVITRKTAQSGSIKIEFTYNSYKGDFSLQTTPAKLEITPPAKTNYKAGEKLNLSGMSIIYNEGNGITKNVELYDVTTVPGLNEALTVNDTRVKVSRTFSDDDVVTGYFDITVNGE